MKKNEFHWILGHVMDIEGNELEDCQKAMAAAPGIQIIKWIVYWNYSAVN